jgi:hypothetical protein
MPRKKPLFELPKSELPNITTGMSAVSFDQRGIPTVNSAEEHSRILATFDSSEAFAKYFLADSFTGPMVAFRKEILSRLDDDTIPYDVECGYRGGGKSSLFLARGLRGICWRKMPFLVYAGASHDLIAMDTENFKSMLMTNPIIKDVFGSLKPSSLSDAPASFSKKAWYVCDPVTGEPYSFVTPKGAGQSCRGMTIVMQGRIHRPYFIAVSDCEDDEEVWNSEIRKKVRHWFYGPLCKCVSQDLPPAKGPSANRWIRDRKNIMWRPPWRVFVLGNWQHDDGLVAHLFKHPHWQHGRYPLARKGDDGQYYTCIPELASDDQIRAQFKAAEDDPEALNELACNLMCVSFPPSKDFGWHGVDFQYFKEVRAAA